MSDTWFKVQTSVVRHPKVLKLTRTQRWVLIELWAFAAEEVTDGFISELNLKQIANKRIQNVLVEHGFLHPDPARGGFQIHDYLDYQRSRADIESIKEKRRQSGRKGGIAKAKRGDDEPESSSNLLGPASSNLLASKPSKSLAVSVAVTDTDMGVKYVGNSPGRATSSTPTPNRQPEKHTHPITRGALALVHTDPDDQPDTDAEPPKQCMTHIGRVGHVEPCGSCRQARLAHEAWQQRNRAAKSTLAEQQRAARAACRFCDEYGWALIVNEHGELEPGTVRCQHEGADE